MRPISAKNKRRDSQQGRRKIDVDCSRCAGKASPWFFKDLGDLLDQEAEAQLDRLLGISTVWKEPIVVPSTSEKPVTQPKSISTIRKECLKAQVEARQKPAIDRFGYRLAPEAPTCHHGIEIPGMQINDVQARHAFYRSGNRACYACWWEHRLLS